MNLNIRLADQDPARAGQPHKWNAQLPVTTFKPLRCQLATDFDGLGKHLNSSVLLPTMS
jgi:hypothetical protein